jgi:NADH-quinone oxidoreductase subunit H
MLTQFVGFVIFMIAVQAELTQTPFDMPIAESELVVRLHHRVLGLPLPDVLHRRVRGGRIAFAAIASTLFLGEVHDPRSAGQHRSDGHLQSRLLS